MDLETQLNQLETAQLVRHLVEEEPAYIFKHVLTQDAAYHSLLQKQRHEIHRNVAHAYEAEYGYRCLDEFAAILAQHYGQAGDAAKALDYEILAGDSAARTFSNAEAILHYTRALELAKENVAQRVRLVQNLYLKRGRIYELNQQHDLALASYEEMETLAHARNDHAMELAALIVRTTIYSIPSRYFDIWRAKALSEQALTLARAIGDQPSEAKILWNMLLFNTRLDTNYRQAIGYGERAIEIARALDLREQLAYLLNDISLLYTFEGDPDRGKTCNLEARELWRTLNNLPMLADNLNYAAMGDIFIGEYADADTVSREALEISQRIGNQWGEAFSQSWIGEAYVELGLIDDAIRAMEDAIRLGETSFRAPLSFTRSDLAALYGDLGQVARGIELALLADAEGRKIAPVMRMFTTAHLAHLHLLNGDVRAAQSVIDKIRDHLSPPNRDSVYGSTIMLAEAETAFAQGDEARAIQHCDRLIDFLRSHRLRQRLTDALYFKGIAVYRQEKLGEAMACLGEARSEAEDTNSRWMLWRVLAALADIEEKRGNHSETQALRAQARQVVEFIAAHTPDDPATPFGTSLRKSFLNLPDVRKVMEP